MDNKLATVFKRVSKPNKGRHWNFDVSTLNQNFADCLNAFHASHHSKIYTSVTSGQQMYSLPRVALLLSDTLMLSGFGADESESIQTIAEFTGGTFNYVGEVSSAPSPIIKPLLFLFPENFLAKWYEDAAPFIADGSLVYLPERSLATVMGNSPEGGKTWGVRTSNPTLPWGYWGHLETPAMDAAPLIPAEKQEGYNAAHIQLLQITLPFIDGISLKLLHKVMQDEGDSIALFRKELERVLPLYLNSIQGLEGAEAIALAASKIRDDLLDPELAKLTKTFGKLEKKRSLKIAGISLNSIALSGWSLLTGDLTPLCKGLVGQGISAAIDRKMHMADVVDAKDNAWYFAWKLQQLSK